MAQPRVINENRQDRHTPLAANPQNAVPVSGQLQPGYLTQSTLEYEIRMGRSPLLVLKALARQQHAAPMFFDW